MDGSAVAALPFLPLAASRAGVRLRCLRRVEAVGEILAHCRGIEVGRRPLPGALAAGMEIEVPIARLPRVTLPAELRFSLADRGPDIAPPWPLPNAAAALELLGPGEVAVEELRLEQGVLRGYATDRANGLLEPVMYARINECGARGVAVERPAPLPEGGCAFRFALPLEPGDLTESGLSVTLHLVGLEAPLARYAFARADAAGMAPRLATLEARLERLERDAAAAARQAEEERRRQAVLQQERIDSFIAAAACLLFDRIAGVPRGEAPADPALLALHRLVAEAATPAAPPAEPPALGTRVEIPPDAGHLAVGWHAPERDAEGPFRWMGEAALVVNPEPFRPVAAAILRIRHLYGAAEPALRAGFDGTPALLRVVRSDLVRLEPEGGPRPCQSLSLEALRHGIPERDGASADPRPLSLAVSAIVFEYAT
jgi:hypothetical protein